MLLLRSLALFPALLLCASGAALSVRGVPKSLAHLYASADHFDCLDGAGRVPASRVNDDYCDCGDGSDEPGTAACGGVGAEKRFYCANRGARPLMLRAALVNDGVCDCCDGSDEAGGVACADTCAADGAAWRAAQTEAIRAAEAGARARAEYAAEGAAAAAERGARLAAAAADLDRAAAAKAAAADDVERSERDERDERARRSAAASSTSRAAAVAALHLDELGREQVIDVVREGGCERAARQRPVARPRIFLFFPNVSARSTPASPRRSSSPAAARRRARGQRERGARAHCHGGAGGARRRR